MVGVGVIFALSGYLITFNLMRGSYWDISLQLKIFWVRCFQRLIPTTLTTVLAVVMLSAAFDASTLRDRAAVTLVRTWTSSTWRCARLRRNIET